MCFNEPALQTRRHINQCVVSIMTDIVLSIFVLASMLALLVLYVRGLFLRAIFIRQLEAMNARLAHHLPLDAAILEIESIPWQTVVQEASFRAKDRMMTQHLVHPLYKTSVEAFNRLVAINSIYMLVSLVPAFVAMVLF